MTVAEIVEGGVYEGGDKRTSTKRITELTSWRGAVWFINIKADGTDGREGCWSPEQFAKWATRRIS